MYRNLFLRKTEKGYITFPAIFICHRLGIILETEMLTYPEIVPEAKISVKIGNV